MNFQRTLPISAVILSLIAVCVQAKHIAECDGAPTGYMNNPSNCSEYIYCDGENSIYCSGDCSTELDCDIEVSTQTTTTTTLTSNVTTSGTDSTLTTQSQSFSASPTIGETTTSVTTSTAVSVREMCRKGTNAKYPYSNNCNYFYQCIDGYLLLQQCPFGYGWDVDSAKCMEMKKVHCEQQ